MYIVQNQLVCICSAYCPSIAAAKPFKLNPVNRRADNACSAEFSEKLINIRSDGRRKAQQEI